MGLYRNLAETSQPKLQVVPGKLLVCNGPANSVQILHRTLEMIHAKLCVLIFGPKCSNNAL